MNKLLIAVSAVFAVIVAALAAAPFVIDWNSFKPEIAEAVREATGRELAIDGDIEVSLGTTVSIKVSGLRLSNRPGGSAPEMLSIGAVEARIELLPLLSRELIVPTLIVSEPKVFLEVDGQGKPNWAFEPTVAPAAAAVPDPAGDEPPLEQIRLGDVRVEKGLVSFVDAGSGVAIEARDIDVAVALASLDSVLAIEASFVLNDEAVTIEAKIDSPAAALRGGIVGLSARVGSKHLEARFDGRAQQRPVPGLDGTFALDVTSVAALAAWLGQPLDANQPDPGGLAVRAKFATDGPKVTLERATVEGEALKVRLEGSFDGAGDVPRIVLDMRSDILDIDRYLPAPSPAPSPAPAPAAEAAPVDPLAALSDAAIELGFLRQVEGRARIAVRGVKAAGFEVSGLVLEIGLEGGVLSADLTELALYGGNVRGKVGLDASGETLGLEAGITMDGVDVGALARAATGDEAPIAGIANGTLSLNTRGASPRALVEGASGRIAFELGGIDLGDTPVGALSQIELDLDLPGLESPPSLKGTVVYNQRRVSFDLTLDPLKKVLSGAPFAARAAIASDLVSATYDGTVQQRPVPGLDGAFDLDIPSVGRLAAWLGQPLDAAQPDPGPLKVRARFAADGAKVTLDEAVIAGEELNLRAKGSFDASGETTKIVLDVVSGVLDIDRYLPPPTEAEAEPRAVAEAAAPGDLLAALSDAAIDLGPLKETEAQVHVAIQGIKAVGIEVGAIAFDAELKDGVLKAELERLDLYGGNVAGQITADASGETLDLEAEIAIDGVDVGALARAATGGEAPVTGIANGTLSLSTRGASPRALVEGASGRIAFQLGGVDVKDAPAGAITEITVDLDLPGLRSPPSFKGSVVYNKQRVSVEATLDPLAKVLSGAPFAAKLGLRSALVTAGYEGMVQQEPVPGLDGVLDIDIPSVGRLAAWLGRPLDAARPDPGPLKVRARFAADGAKVTLDEAYIEGDDLNFRATGSFDGSGETPRIVLDMRSGVLDIDRYLPPPAPPSDEPEPAGSRGDPLAALPREPFDLSPLRLAEAEVHIAIEGVKAAGFEVGAVALAAVLKEGVLTAELERLALYGGNVSGTLTLDGAGTVLGLETALAVEGIALDRIAAAAGVPAPFAAVISATLAADARGTSPRALVEALSAKLAVELGDIELEDAAVGEIGALRLAADLPGLAEPLRLDGSLSYNREPVTVALTLGPVEKIIAGGEFAASARLTTSYLQLAFEGRVAQRPEPGASGVLDLDVASPKALAAWLGQPLGETQPDPGPLRLHLDFSAAGTMLTLNDLTLDGEALAVRAAGSIDGGGEVPRLVLDIGTGIIDLDRYLPARPPPGQEPGQEKAPGNPLEALPDEPFDLSPLRLVEAEINLTIEGIRAGGRQVGPIALEAGLEDGALRVALHRLDLHGGTVTGTIALDGAARSLGLDVDIAIAGVDVGRLAAALGESEAPLAATASASLIASARGATPRALVEGLRAKLAARLTGIALKDAPPGIDVSEIAFEADLPGLDETPSASGAVTLNGERVTLDVSSDPLAKVLAGETFQATVSLSSRRISATFKGTVRQGPAPGLDGVLDLDVGSVGKLAAWLGRPLDQTQPDPGPLKVHARFAAAADTVELTRATVTGEGLELRASGSFDGGGEVPRIVLAVESGPLDIDRYLPPPAGDTGPAAAPEAEEVSGDPLAAISDEPFDLAGLRRAEADLRLDIESVKARGFRVGPIGLTASLHGGVLEAELARLGLYGGTVSGRVSLDGATEELGVDAAFTFDKIDVGALGRAAMGAEAPVSAVAGGNLLVKARGRSPLAVLKALSGKLTLGLAGLEIEDAGIGTIAQVDLDLDLPGFDKPWGLIGAVVYNNERIGMEARLDPLAKVLAGQRFAIRAAVASRLITAGYDGVVIQRPLPGLDGKLVLDVPSVGRLAAWAGKPLDPGQPDPGPLKIRARFAADGSKATLEQATIEGKAIRARASGSLDTSGSRPSVVARLTIDEADLNAYLPPDRKQPGAQGRPAPTGSAKGWSREPFDLEPLSALRLDLRVETGPVRYKNLVVERSRVAVSLRGGVLEAKIEELRLAGGNVTAAVTVKASGRTLELDYRASVVNVEALPVLMAFADSDKLSGKMNLETRGRARGGSQLQLVSTLMGDGRVRFLDGAINGINIAETLRNIGSLGFGGSGPVQRTDFAELGGTFTIANGVIDNRDLRMLAPLVRVTGAGLVPMPPRTLDYRLEAKLVATTQGQGGKDSLSGLPIPIRITGSWDDPSYSVDWGSFFAQMSPADLANLPNTLKGVVENLGIALPGGGDGGVGGALGGILGAIPGLGGGDSSGTAAPAPTTTTTAPAPSQPPPSPEQRFQDALQDLLNPSDRQGQGDEPDIIKGLKGLFGGN